VVDFAETYDETRLEESRERFRSYRELGFNPVMR
jgi:DNA polymerase IIIc chi subunit